MNDEEGSTEVFLFQKHLLSAFHLQQLQSQGKLSSSRGVCSDQSNAECAGGDAPANVYPKNKWKFGEISSFLIKFLSSHPLLVLTWPQEPKIILEQPDQGFEMYEIVPVSMNFQKTLSNDISRLNSKFPKVNTPPRILPLHFSAGAREQHMPVSSMCIAQAFSCQGQLAFCPDYILFLMWEE